MGKCRDLGPYHPVPHPVRRAGMVLVFLLLFLYLADTAKGIKQMTHTEELTELLMNSYDRGVKDAMQEAVVALEKTVALTVAAEREACARVCEFEWSNAAERAFAEQCASLIRGREANRVEALAQPVQPTHGPIFRKLLAYVCSVPDDGVYAGTLYQERDSLIEEARAALSQEKNT